MAGLTLGAHFTVLTTHLLMPLTSQCLSNPPWSASEDDGWFGWPTISIVQHWFANDWLLPVDLLFGPVDDKEHPLLHRKSPMLVRLRPLTKYIAAQNAALGQAAAAQMVQRQGCALTVPVHSPHFSIFEKKKEKDSCGARYTLTHTCTKSICLRANACGQDAVDWC
jgi:hypothetical protein